MFLLMQSVEFLLSWSFDVCDKMQSDDEREMCSRTVYCTNIDKKVYKYISWFDMILFFIILIWLHYFDPDHALLDLLLSVYFL